MDRDRERHWQRAWAEAGVARARRSPGSPKFYAVVAYPGPSGFLHLGHLRGLLLADALVRHQRMLGRRVFFPTGTHASGLPAVTFARKVEARDPAILQQLADNDVPESTWKELEDPASAARFLGEGYLRAYARLGILIDEAAYVTTIDDDYRAFIRWQFGRLQRANALGQGPYYAAFCPVCGPVSVDPSETDLSTGGDAETTVFTLVPFRLADGRTLLAATLRPETVYGVTNLWLAPGASLVLWHHHGGEFLVSRAGGERLVEQHGGRLGSAAPVETLLGHVAESALTQRKVPILVSGLVDPSVGTGVVMSVPAHAPSDWLAVSELSAADRAKVGAIPEIIELAPSGELTASERELAAGDGPPAARACRVAGAVSLDERARLHDATERLYRLELARGQMRVGPLTGSPVSVARPEVQRLLSSEPGGGELREFSVPVVCRNGHAVIIRRVPNQWFLRYSDAEWKAATRETVSRMTVRPEEYARELPEIVDWYQDRPAIRQGPWLGTPFPLDESWVIEPIADSTFYPAYFIVRPFVADGRLRVDQLTDALFDWVFLGEGPGEPSVARDLAEELRAEFLYWYPLDVNIGGKEHKRVHFPVFLFTHARLLPPELRPKGLFVHWWLTRPDGGKISKKEVSSKGGAIPPMREAVERWGADALRLYFYQSASPQQDIDWQAEQVDHAVARLQEVERMAREADARGTGAPAELDRWLSAAMHDALERIHRAMEARELRDAVEVVYGTIPALLRRYRTRGGEWGDATRRLRDAWVRAMHPFTPHLSEELGRPDAPGLVVVAPFPSAEEFPASPGALEAEAYLGRVEEDLREVTRLARARGETADGAAFFVAAAWKRVVEDWLRVWAREGAQGNPTKEVMARARQHPELASRLADIPGYVQRVSGLVRQESMASALSPAEEVALLRSTEGYLARRFDLRMVSIHPEEQAGEEDPLHRRTRARPGQPAFYLFGVHARAQVTASATDGPES